VYTTNARAGVGKDVSAATFCLSENARRASGNMKNRGPNLTKKASYHASGRCAFFAAPGPAYVAVPARSTTPQRTMGVTITKFTTAAPNASVDALFR
jgi:hypothetical protein